LSRHQVARAWSGPPLGHAGEIAKDLHQKPAVPDTLALAPGADLVSCRRSSRLSPSAASRGPLAGVRARGRARSGRKGCPGRRTPRESRSLPRGPQAGRGRADKPPVRPGPRCPRSRHNSDRPPTATTANRRKTVSVRRGRWADATSAGRPPPGIDGPRTAAAGPRASSGAPVDERKHILELIAKAVGAAGLVERRAPPQAAA